MREASTLRRAVVRPLVRVLGAPAGAALATALRLSGRRVGVALVYHAVALPVRDPEREILPPHPPDLFAAQLRHLARWYRVVDARELRAAAAGRRRGERFPVALTFDDDLREHVDRALPALVGARAQATFFLCGCALDRPVAFWWQRLQRAADAGHPDLAGLVSSRSPLELEPRPPLRRVALAVELMGPADRDAVAAELLAYAGPDPETSGLRREDVRALVEAGMQVGFHTLRHDALDLLPDDELARALQRGRSELEAVVGEPIRTIAYPHGRADERVARAARAAGFEHGFAGQGKPVRPEVDPLLVPRMTPSHRSAGHFALQLALALLGAGGRRRA